jgi:hypothetical protein
MTRRTRLLPVCLLAAIALGLGAASWAAGFAEARIFIEYNSTDNDLGFHVFLDGEDWKTLKIVNPNGRTIFEVAGRGAFEDLGLTELFFEGAEPSLDDIPLDELLALFPEGIYTFSGVTVDGVPLVSRATLTHAVPSGPRVSARLDDDTVTISWQPVASPPAGFPDRQVRIVGYQVIVGSFQVTLPASNRNVTLPQEFVKSLGRGEHEFEVLAIDSGRNQTITSGTFTLGRMKGIDDD